MKDKDTSGKALVGAPVAIAAVLALLTSLATGWAMYTDSVASEDEAIHAAQLGVIRAATDFLQGKTECARPLEKKIGAKRSYAVTLSKIAPDQIEVESIGRAGYHTRGIRVTFRLSEGKQPSAKLLTDTWQEFEPGA